MVMGLDAENEIIRADRILLLFLFNYSRLGPYSYRKIMLLYSVRSKVLFTTEPLKKWIIRIIIILWQLNTLCIIEFFFYTQHHGIVVCIRDIWHI